MTCKLLGASRSFPGGTMVKNLPANTGCLFYPWEKILWRRKWQTTPVFLAENPMDRGAWCTTVHGWQTVGHHWATKRACTNTHTHTHTHTHTELFTVVSPASRTMPNPVQVHNICWRTPNPDAEENSVSQLVLQGLSLDDPSSSIQWKAFTTFLIFV